MVWQTHSLASSGQDHGFQIGRGLNPIYQVSAQLPDRRWRHTGPTRDLAIRKTSGGQIGQEIPDGNRGTSYAAAGAAIAHRIGATGIVPMDPLPHFLRVSSDLTRHAGSVALLGDFIE